MFMSICFVRFIFLFLLGSDNYEVSSQKYNEICTIINILKSNKAACTDNIPPEFEPKTI